jgi:hypothetical protein
MQTAEYKIYQLASLDMPSIEGLEIFSRVLYGRDEQDLPGRVTTRRCPSGPGGPGAVTAAPFGEDRGEGALNSLYYVRSTAIEG